MGREEEGLGRERDPYEGEGVVERDEEGLDGREETGNE
jgi:hypothetical protein